MDEYHAAEDEATFVGLRLPGANTPLGRDGGSVTDSLALTREEQPPAAADAPMPPLGTSVGRDSAEITPAGMPLTSPAPTGPAPTDTGPSPEELVFATAAAMALVKAYRTHGHLVARLDPLGSIPPEEPSLDPTALGLSERLLEQIPAAALRVGVTGETLAEALPRLREIYCGTLAFEVEHLQNHAERVWIRQAIETRRYRHDLTEQEQLQILRRLLRVEGLERYIRRAYLGAKQFSIEGLEAMILMMDELVALAAADDTETICIGMAHRGRLNVLAHVLRLPYEQLLAEFEADSRDDVDTLQPERGTGDVKYHYGNTTMRRVKSPLGERELRLELLPNPSHLEFVNPVVLGRVRALQEQKGGWDPTRALALLIHGDAAFMGQGVVGESLNLAGLDTYTTGGAIHIIANNQIGFTTEPNQSRSTRHCSDLAKGYDMPIIHVNAEDIIACREAISLAYAFRERFHKDVVIDLVGYRRWGHNEGDEPGYTQPLMTEQITGRKSLPRKYGVQLIAGGLLSEDELDGLESAVAARLAEARTRIAEEPPSPLPGYTSPVRHDLPTGVLVQRLQRLGMSLLETPEAFHLHPKLEAIFERRRAALESPQEPLVDWGLAEQLAYASLLEEGVQIRLTGQDAERGTFSHRHAVLHDYRSGARHIPLAAGERRFFVSNSPLTETACLGFEYGYALCRPDDLVLWEAQFGDFANVAQVIIDQFITSGRTKWGDECRLTMLLPHGYEGSGPEHSSARIERYLKLAAEDNITLCQPSTARQCFHLLRRQALSEQRRPLIVFTPKAGLRLKAANSALLELGSGEYEEVLDDPDCADWREDVDTAILVSGKLAHDLHSHPRRMEAAHAAIIRLEQLYPFPLQQLERVLRSYAGLKRVVWAQEEPANMGAWRALRHRFEQASQGLELRYAGRSWRSSPSEGYLPDHRRAQEQLILDALGLK